MQCSPHLYGKVIPTLVSLVFCGVSVFIRRQKLAPNVSFSSFKGGHVDRKAQRISEAFKGAIKDVVRGECSNSRHIQIMELVFYKWMLSKTLWNWVRILGMGQNVWLCVGKIQYETPRLHVNIIKLIDLTIHFFKIGKTLCGSLVVCSIW